MVNATRRVGVTLLAGALLTSGACSKKAEPPAGALAATPPSTADDAGAATGAKKVVTAKPIAKVDAKPGPAALGRNLAIDLGEVAARPVAQARGRFVLRYDGADSETRALVRRSGVFEKLVPQLNQSLRMPRDIAVVFEDCDEVNAFYDDEAVEITMCNEYVDFYGELFSRYPDEDARDAVIGSVVSTFLHEAGHALIDQLELPTVGREEDVADQLSTVILVASGEEGNAMALSGAYAFIAEAEADGEEPVYWGEHSLDQQRFYNTVCLIYGSDPEGWDDLVGDDDLPEERAEQCAEEYRQVSTAWTRLLRPFLTVPTVRVKLTGDK